MELHGWWWEELAEEATLNENLNQIMDWRGYWAVQGEIGTLSVMEEVSSQNYQFFPEIFIDNIFFISSKLTLEIPIGKLLNFLFDFILKFFV